MWRTLILIVRFVLVLSAGQLTITAGAQLGAQGDEQFDPLALYQDIMPGARVTALAGYSCAWHVEYVTGNVNSTCRFTVLADHFASVEVFALGTLIQTVRFQAKNLRVGDMPQYWGAPVMANYATHSIALWHIGNYAVRAFLSQDRQHNELWTPISYVTIWRHQLSD
jgi:hypothetical protein